MTEVTQSLISITDSAIQPRSSRNRNQCENQGQEVEDGLREGVSFPLSKLSLHIITLKAQSLSNYLTFTKPGHRAI